jgi:hypothetical protein
VDTHLSAESHLVRQIIRNQVVGGVRQQDLPAVTQRENAGNTIEWWAEVITVAQFGRPGMQRHAHPQRASRSPRFGVQRTLHSERGGQPVGGTREDRMHAIADRLENHTALRIDRLPQHRIVARKGRWHRPRVLLPQLRAAFDVGEQEGEGAGRQRRGRQGLGVAIRCCWRWAEDAGSFV